MKQGFARYVLVLSIVLSSGAAHAATTYTYSFTGTIGSFFDSTNLFAADGSSGASYTGSLVYTDNLVDSIPSSTIGDYSPNSSNITSLSISVGTSEFTRSSTDSSINGIKLFAFSLREFNLSLGNNTDDSFTVPTDASLVTVFAGFFLRGGTMTAIPSDDLSDITNLTLSQFASSKFIGINVADPSDLSKISGFQGNLSSLTLESAVTVAPVPLPAALPLFGTGLALLGFVGWRRKRATAA